MEKGEINACKPDSVRLETEVFKRDDHFSAFLIAQKVTISVAKNRSDQPENCAGRVDACAYFAFCLVLHRTEVTLPALSPKRRCALTLRLAPAPFHPDFPKKAVCFLWPCSVWRFETPKVAVSDRPALRCPDFPHNFAPETARSSGVDFIVQSISKPANTPKRAHIFPNARGLFLLDFRCAKGRNCRSNRRF